MKVAVVLALSASVAVAGPSSNAVAQLGDVYRPLAQLPAAVRVQRACADVDKLKAAIVALPKHVPADVPLDDRSWSLVVGISLGINTFQSACQAPGQKLFDGVTGKSRTADELWPASASQIEHVLDAGRPRDVPPAIKRARTTLDGAMGKRSPCTHASDLAKQMAALGDAPAGADAAQWQAAVQAVQKDSAELGDACKPHGADEDRASALEDMHDRFYDLVLLLPPRV
jgi:hypothetical protein